MAENSLLCLGYGYTARFLADRLKRKGWRIAGTARTPEKTASLRAQGVEAALWRDDGIESLAFDTSSAVLVSTPPGETGCPAYAAASETIARLAGKLQWMGYLSTNGVYGDHEGAWVDEESDLRATSGRAKRRIKAETQWRAFAHHHGLPLIVFRLPGIYGPGRSALDAARDGRAKRIYKEGQVFSRMHVEDIALALEASMTRPLAFDLYNLADDEPAPPQDVVAYACALLGIEPPPLTPIDDADLSEMAKSFYTDNKRVCNRRMKEALQIPLAYPTYREGLRAILAAEG